MGEINSGDGKYCFLNKFLIRISLAYPCSGMSVLKILMDNVISSKKTDKFTTKQILGGWFIR